MDRPPEIDRAGPVTAGCLLITIVVLIGSSLSMARGETLVWNQEARAVDADIQSWPLENVLRRIGFSTGWRIFVEPGIDRPVSSRFAGVGPREALRLLLGELNFALIPTQGAGETLYVFRTSVQAATAPLRPEAPKRSGVRIPNELIVTLVPEGGESIEDLARRLGAKVVGKAEGLNAYRLRFKDESSAEAARKLLNGNPAAGSVDANFAYDWPERLANTAYSPSLGFHLKPGPAAADGQIIVGMLDTPVQSLAESMKDFLLPALHVAGDPGSLPGDLTHGTSMAETILHGLAFSSNGSEASPVRLLPIDIYGANEGTSTFEMAAGIFAAVQAGATIINMSLGGEGDSPFLNRIIHDAHQNGVVFFGSAGNNPTTFPTFPAAFPEVVAVTAGDRSGNIAPYANRGDFVDVIAPGLSLVEFNGDHYFVTGTSAATAFVSGTAAGVSASGRTPQEVEAIIRESLALRPPSSN